jgi:drug/metabolite transporter (DMT)-like permease
VTAIAWGSMFIIVKKALAYVSTPQLMGMRFFAMFILVLPFLPGLATSFLTPGKLERPVKNGLVWLPFLGTLAPVFMITLAQTSVGSGSTGLLHAIGPLCALVVGVLFYGEKVNAARIVGILLGFVGVAILVVGAKTAKVEGEAWAFGLLLVSLFCYGFSTHMIRQRLSGLTVMSFPTATFTVLAIPALMMFFGSGGPQTLESFQGTPALSVVISLVLLQSVVALIAHICYTQTIVRRGAVFAISVNYLVPIVALSWGFFDGESVSALHFLSFALVGLGLYLVNKTKNRL